MLGNETIPLTNSMQLCEHLATRRSAGLFDFSFMGLWEIAGPDSTRFLHVLQTRSLGSLQPGRLWYTLLCREDGLVLNDATIWRHDANHYWLFTGRRADSTYIASYARGLDVTVTNFSGQFAVFALQGPRSHKILRSVFASLMPNSLPYFGFQKTSYRQYPAWIGRLGYSGEFGFEIVLPCAVAEQAWREFCAIGMPFGMVPCGFLAADSLRIESGYIFFENELAQSTTPYELGLGRFVDSFRLEFNGSKALRSLRFAPSIRTLVGVELEGKVTRNLARSKDQILARLTSQCYSPILSKTIGLALIDTGSANPGSRVYTDEGRRWRVARLPFYDPARFLPRHTPSG